jgi:hypothetical protein
MEDRIVHRMLVPNSKSWVTKVAVVRDSGRRVRAVALERGVIGAATNAAATLGPLASRSSDEFA